MSNTIRDVWLASTKRYMRNFGPSSLSCKEVIVNDEKRNILIINSQDYDLKYAHCILGDALDVGEYLIYDNNTQLVTKAGGDSEIYPSYVIQKCNYTLKWVKNDETITRLCVAEDMTYSQTGIQENNYMAYGDGRFRVFVPKDKDTMEIRRTDRFYVDDDDCVGNHIAYEVSKLDRVTGVYGDYGVYKLILLECNAHGNDDPESMVADNDNSHPIGKDEWL